VENVSPLLHSVTRIRFSLERGESMQQACRTLVADPSQRHCRLKAQIESLLLAGTVDDRGFQAQTVNFLSLVQAGLQGQAVHSQLLDLEADVFEMSSLEIEKFSALLPIIGLFPLLFLIFPALVILTIVPYIESLSAPF